MNLESWTASIPVWILAIDHDSLTVSDGQHQSQCEYLLLTMTVWQYLVDSIKHSVNACYWPWQCDSLWWTASNPVWMLAIDHDSVTVSDVKLQTQCKCLLLSLIRCSTVVSDGQHHTQCECLLLTLIRCSTVVSDGQYQSPCNNPIGNACYCWLVGIKSHEVESGCYYTWSFSLK